MTAQLAFDLPARASLRRADFFVSPANALALATVEAATGWPLGKMLLIGPEGSGKTHLAHVWAEAAGAVILQANALAAADVKQAFASISSGEPATETNQLSALPFDIDVVAPFRVIQTLAGSSVLMMAGDLDADPEGIQPSVIVAYSTTQAGVELKGTAEAALKVWLEIGLSVARAGVRKIVIVNSHGGNLDLVSILSRELRVRAGMLAVKCQWTGFGHPEGMYSPHELAFGIHGGDVETSLMLQFNPDTVDMSAARDFRSSAEGAAIPPTGALSYGWIASDLNPAGVVGNAAAATAEKGRATAEHQVRGFVGLLRAVAAHPMAGMAAAEAQGGA